MEKQLIEAMGMRLANRAYLYRVFHIVFGAEPSKDELRLLGSPETIEAFRHLEEQDPEAFSPVAADLLVSLGDEADDDAFAASMKSDFMRLFVVPGETYVHPWESSYTGKEAMLFQESTLDVRHRYAEHGFVAVELGHFPEDHVSMMLDFLAYLSIEAFEAFGDEKDDRVRVIVSFQLDFVVAHLLNWMPDFCAKLNEHDHCGPYDQLARALHAFLSADARFMEAALAVLGAGEPGVDAMPACVSGETR